MSTVRTNGEVAAEVRDVIESAVSNPEDRENLWDDIKRRIDSEPFYFEDPEDHPSLTAAERNR